MKELTIADGFDDKLFFLLSKASNVPLEVRVTFWLLPAQGLKGRVRSLQPAIWG